MIGCPTKPAARGVHTAAEPTVATHHVGLHAVARRQAIALALAMPMLASRKPASAFLGLDLPRVAQVSLPDVCQARLRDQDFAVVRYTGRFSNGTTFDTRYAKDPLTFEVGTFYLPGVDAALEGTCVGSKLRFSWQSSPVPVDAADAQVLPPGSSIVIDMDVLSIKCRAR